MGDVYGNVNVNYSYCKSVAQLKSAADYILGRRKYSWRYETSIFFWKKLRIEVLSDGSCGGFIK